ncbi:unnamed protein product [Amoebophrya sp. A25]|nr:unnamed protein product [Amoebophrya sp. A25]|eukprot:GSA25T00020512001.1
MVFLASLCLQWPLKMLRIVATLARLKDAVAAPLYRPHSLLPDVVDIWRQPWEFLSSGLELLLTTYLLLVHRRYQTTYCSPVAELADCMFPSDESVLRQRRKDASRRPKCSPTTTDEDNVRIGVQDEDSSSSADEKEGLLTWDTSASTFNGKISPRTSSSTRSTASPRTGSSRTRSTILPSRKTTTSKVADKQCPARQERGRARHLFSDLDTTNADDQTCDSLELSSDNDGKRDSLELTCDSSSASLLPEDLLCRSTDCVIHVEDEDSAEYPPRNAGPRDSIMRLNLCALVDEHHLYGFDKDLPYASAATSASSAHQIQNGNIFLTATTSSSTSFNHDNSVSTLYDLSRLLGDEVPTIIEDVADDEDLHGLARSLTSILDDMEIADTLDVSPKLIDGDEGEVSKVTF